MKTLHIVIPTLTLALGSLAQAAAPVVGSLELEGGARPVGAGPVTTSAPVDAPAEAVGEPREEQAQAPAPEVRAVSAKDESIYVLQRRSYSKKGKIEISPIFITGINPKFVGYLGGGVSAAYHAYENFALEFTTSLPFMFYAFYSDLVYEVYHYQDLTPEAVDLKQMSYFGALSMQLSALYGKFRFYDWVMDYDFYATAGAGIVRTLETCNALDDDCGEMVEDIGRGLRVPSVGVDSTKLSANLGAGMRLFFSERLGVRVELRDIVYADRAMDTASKNTTDIRNNLLLFLGASLML